MQGFVKTVGVNTKQILFCTDPQVSVGIIVDDSGVDAGDDGRKIVKAGTPMYGSLLDRATPFTVNSSATEASATVNETITTVATDQVYIDSVSTFSTAVEGVNGTYVFEYNSSEGTWWVSTATGTFIDAVANSALSSTFGISYMDSPSDGDKMAIDFTAAIEDKAVGVLLHDVDVTAGDDNGTLLIFGFVNINRLDEATAAAIQAAASDLDGKVFVCAG